jgi:diadenosine tetraphosphatase ApaH/serine/threonine PP2A family protein phosphatase
MRYAVLSDVHGNLEALRAVLEDASARAEGVLCLGDVVGYGPDPTACLEILAGRALAMIGGNHERGVAGLLDLGWFNRNARAAVEWTRQALDADHRAYLGSLPLLAHVDDATLVHASPARPDEWDYLVSARDGWEAFGAFSTRLCFVGHSHLPGVWSLGSSGPDHEVGDVDVAFEAGRRYIVNVGSVGQPRDRDPRAAYGLWDSAERRLTIRRVPYDSDRTRQKIVEAGLPRPLADRLLSGS